MTMSIAVKRKLVALGHPNATEVDLSESMFQRIVVWLEDTKIRHYKIEDREALRNVESPEWTGVFTNYLSDIKCPMKYESGCETSLLDWLVGFAVRLEYADNADKLSGFSSENVQTGVKQTGNPLDNLDFDSPEFKAGIISIAQMLEIPPYTDHREVLKAVSRLITVRLSNEAIAKSNRPTFGKPPEKINLDNMQLGFDTEDYIINNAARLLRLLHIKNLRELQTAIDHAIVAVQSKTADPKTDQRLGKVGV